MFTTLFITFLLIDLGLRVWLSSRQIRHVALHRDSVPIEFSDRIGLHSHQRAADYTIAKMRLNIVERLVEAAVLVGLTLMGGLQLLDVVLTPLFDSDIARQLMLIGAVLALMGIIGLPFTIWRIFKLEARFGFNRITPRLFIQDFFKTLMIALILGIPLVAGVLWIMANAGENWVWWAWAAWVAFNFLILWLFPTVIAPLFNKFTPLDNPEIADRINNLAKRCGFELNGLFVMDGSKRSAHGNAYFTGFGKSRRIVFFDTLLARLKPQEIEAVLAHELGHFSHKHIIKRMFISFSMALVFFLALGWLSTQVWFYVDLGVLPALGRANDGMALILFFLVIPVFTFWIGPLTSWFSRRDEYEADRYAAEQSSSQELISALVKLYDDNAATLTPDPLHSAFYDSHPGAVQRIQHLKHA
jgi:STE24 endopeptidase